MSARRCPICLINYPVMSSRFHECAVCGTKTDLVNNIDPDDDWNESVIFAKEHMTTESDPDVKKPVILYTDGGFLWLDAHDLVRAGYLDNIPSFTRLTLHDGSVVEVQGRDQKNRRYWIEHVEPDPNGKA